MCSRTLRGIEVRFATFCEGRASPLLSLSRLGPWSKPLCMADELDTAGEAFCQRRRFGRREQRRNLDGATEERSARGSRVACRRLLPCRTVTLDNLQCSLRPQGL